MVGEHARGGGPTRGDAEHAADPDRVDGMEHERLACEHGLASYGDRAPCEVGVLTTRAQAEALVEAG